MQIFEDRPAGIVVVGLKRGENIFESLEAVAKQCDIHTGVVTSGIGSLTKGYIHTVDSNDYPPKEAYIHLEGPLEVVAYVRDRRLLLVVRDEGHGIAPRTDSPGLGLGLPLIATLAEALELGTDERDRTEVRMTFRLDEDGEAAA